MNELIVVFGIVFVYLLCCIIFVTITPVMKIKSNMTDCETSTVDERETLLSNVDDEYYVV